VFASGLFVACRNHLAFAFIDPGDHDITEACKPRHLHGQRMAAAPRRAAGRWPTAGPAHRRRARAGGAAGAASAGAGAPARARRGAARGGRRGRGRRRARRHRAGRRGRGRRAALPLARGAARARRGARAARPRRPPSSCPVSHARLLAGRRPRSEPTRRAGGGHAGRRRAGAVCLFPRGGFGDGQRQGPAAVALVGTRCPPAPSRGCRRRSQRILCPSPVQTSASACGAPPRTPWTSGRMHRTTQARPVARRVASWRWQQAPHLRRGQALLLGDRVGRWAPCIQGASTGVRFAGHAERAMLGVLDRGADAVPAARA